MRTLTPFYRWLVVVLLVLLSTNTGCAVWGSSGSATKPELPRLAVSAANHSAALSQTRVVIERPYLIIHGLSEKSRQNSGEVAKAYVATVIQLLQYAEQLETIVKQLQEPVTNDNSVTHAP